MNPRHRNPLNLALDVSADAIDGPPLLFLACPYSHPDVITRTKRALKADDVAARLMAAGYAVFSPKLAGFVLSAFQNGSPAGMGGPASGPIHDDELDRLSNREQEVMRLIARGYTYKEVAAELFISIKTVETHVSSVLRKLQLSNRTELTRWAADRRIV